MGHDLSCVAVCFYFLSSLSFERKSCFVQRFVSFRLDMRPFSWRIWRVLHFRVEFCVTFTIYEVGSLYVHNGQVYLKFLLPFFMLPSCI